MLAQRVILNNTKNLIKKLHNQGKTIIILTHELEKIMGLSTHFVVLFKGHKVFDGSPENAFNENLENWGIKNPLTSYKNIKDLVSKNKISSKFLNISKNHFLCLLNS